MRKKKSMQEMSVDELLELAKLLAERRERRNAQRRKRRQWRKTAPREETALRYRAEEKPCPVALYLEAERFVLRWLGEFPDWQQGMPRRPCSRWPILSSIGCTQGSPVEDPDCSTARPFACMSCAQPRSRLP
jgi:hypothetical protein